MNAPAKLSVTLDLVGVMHVDGTKGSRNVELFEVRMNNHDNDTFAVLATGPRQEAIEMALLRCRNMLRGLENMLAATKLSAG